ncbi:hypothetical protein [Lactococcus petauri]|uniref:hypothetical protein n=1 Tax=Lactococcus petauri TaxID=1940789 RepID=UPI0025517EFF|nr:hypothetical protein [Lactococcus petauri]
MNNKIENQKVSISVKVEGIDQLMTLADQLKRQVKEVEDTINEIQYLNLELKINQ